MKEDKYYILIGCPEFSNMSDDEDDEEEDSDLKQIGNSHILWDMFGPVDTQEQAAQKVQEMISNLGMQTPVAIIKGQMLDMTISTKINISLMEDKPNGKNRIF